MYRLISVVDVDINPLNPYQPLPFQILSFANIFQSKILLYAGSNIDNSYNLAACRNSGSRREKLFEKIVVI